MQFDSQNSDVAALALMRAVMGPQLLLSNLSANITGPGGRPMIPHCDQQFVALSLWDQAVTGNVLWTLTAMRKYGQAVEDGVDGDYPRHALPEKEVKR